MRKCTALTALVIALNITTLTPAVSLYTDGVWPCGGSHILEFRLGGHVCSWRERRGSPWGAGFLGNHRTPT
jgi:hypothetical protein